MLLCIFEFAEKLLNKIGNSSNFVNAVCVLPAENEAVIHITKIGIQKRQRDTISRSFDFAGSEASVRTGYFQFSFYFKVF